jgi:putative lipoic acid-binding regulatory protein
MTVLEVTPDDSPLEFPCDFPIKVMGRTADDFDALVVSLVRRHAPDLGEGAVKTRLSRGGRFMSVTVTIRAVSRRQLDAIYMDLTAHERVLMAL